ncbi:hypothetical protein CROQUDRAFT_719547 [Cronartium quercuum f. sp. fusiforme G11]|uniref:RanBD1 domain-containing protein n=1 Tax=Cronartium quercuum f. sp. fusiforme G11 TaxID=708437 RepID=A0A9P6NYQ6_9BASI|nr:hypothetical protein CROQUDRAFT_719547 [Cronartium quercuum f. sp. fusiforme G11]
MVKRTAEKELTDRNWLDKEDDDGAQEGPMKVAAPQVIEKRQIRSLPKKTAAAPATVSPAPVKSAFGSSPPNNPFASLNPPASSSPFSFGSNPTSNDTSSPFGNMSTFATTTTGSLFGNTISSSPFGAKTADKSNPSPLFGTPQTTSSSTNNTSSFFTAGTSSSTSLAKPSTQALTTFYASLRGLNLSVVSALERVIKNDGFTNLDPVFDRLKVSYNKQRELIVKEFEANGGSPPKQSSETTDSAKQLRSPFSNPAPAPSPASNLSSPTEPSVHQPPKLAQPGANQSTKSLEVRKDNSGTQNHKTGSRPGAFTTAAPARPSPLRFETERDVTETQTSTAIKEGPTDPKPLSNSSFSPGSAPSTTTASFTNKPSNSIFGSLSNQTAPSTTFTDNAVSLFGSAKPSSTKSFSFGATVNPPTNAATPAKSAFDFGHGKAGSPSSAGSLFGGFGSSPKLSETSPPKTGFNPVGFSFGANISPPIPSSTKPAPKSDTIESISTDSIKTSTFSEKNLGGDDITTDKDEEFGSKVKGDKNEEDEKTLFETQGRIYAYLDKDQIDGSKSKQWVGWAICTIKLNQNLENSKIRLLARNKTNTNVLLNFNLHENFTTEIKDTTVKFIGFEGNIGIPYMIRFNSLKLSEEFNQSINNIVKSL